MNWIELGYCAIAVTAPVGLLFIHQPWAWIEDRSDELAKFGEVFGYTGCAVAIVCCILHILGV